MKRSAVFAVLGGALLGSVGTGGCAVHEVMPPPYCAGDSSEVITVQSVPGASQVPCLERLPEGWKVAAVDIAQHGMTMRLDSDRAGDNAATLHFEAECDISEAVPVTSEFMMAARHDQIDRLEPGFRAARYYTFPGGCVWWTFDFDDGASATESVAIGDTLRLVSRQDFNDAIRESFLDVEV